MGVGPCLFDIQHVVTPCAYERDKVCTCDQFYHRCKYKNSHISRFRHLRNVSMIINRTWLASLCFNKRVDTVHIVPFCCHAARVHSAHVLTNWSSICICTGDHRNVIMLLTCTYSAILFGCSLAICWLKHVTLWDQIIMAEMMEFGMITRTPTTMPHM